MDSLAATILAVIEQAAISGLYRKEQLQIGVQEARKLRPDLSDDALFELAKTVHGLSGMMSNTECSIPWSLLDPAYNTRQS
ncbi:MAG: hypothetical protein E2O38_11260 [Proteobacteria bacterium]|nr:MAG: hypothetical protein E2O38_11260 [Pseudomonadota bacterium]